MTSPTDEELVARLREPIIADAMAAGQLTNGILAERIINERGEAAARIEALSALSREGEGWREIETAKPGPPVMLWIPGFVGAEVCVGVVRDCEAYGVTMLEWVDRDIGEPFETIDGPVYPTHWRPLPAPPSQGGE